MNLPVVGNIKNHIWRDRKSLKLVWYAPDVEVVNEQGDPNDLSIFSFQFKRLGVTQSGTAGLEGVIKFSLRLVKSEKTKEAIKNSHKSGKPVLLKNIHCRLLIPFIDDKDGKEKIHPFVAEVDQNEDILHCKATLINNWVRVAYNAISSNGSGSTKAKIALSYTFRGYHVIKKMGGLKLDFGGKVSETEIAYDIKPNHPSHLSNISLIQEAKKPLFDASNLILYGRNFELKFKPDEKKSQPRTTPISSVWTGSHVIDPSIYKPILPSPILATNPHILNEVEVIEYAERNYRIKLVNEISFDCIKFGRHYREEKSDGSILEIGCRDALKLGSTEYVSYVELSELRSPEFTVYQSTTQPGYFLINPTAYCLSRKSSIDISDPYKPLIFLNAVIDPEDEKNNQYQLRATLQPNIPFFKIQDLKNDFNSFPS